MSRRNDDPSYNDTHRAFLQSLMARGTLTYSESRPLLAAIQTAYTGEDVTEDDISEEIFQDYISQASSVVSDFDYEIRSTIPQNPDLLDIQQGGTARHNASGGRRSGGSGWVGGNVRYDAKVAPASVSNTSAGTERVYAIINVSSDVVTQLATTFTPDELAFVKRVLDEMFERNNTERREICAVSGKTALGLHSVRGGDNNDRRRTAGSQIGLFGGTATAAATPGAASPATQDPTSTSISTPRTAGIIQPISMTQAQTVLNSLVTQGWFEMSRRGYYTLTPRALLELRTWLIGTYNDDDEDDNSSSHTPTTTTHGNGQPYLRIKTCMACKDLVTIGQRCSRRTCTVRLHDACTERYFKIEKAERCSACKSDWAEHGFVGERAVDGGGATAGSGTGVNGGAGRRTTGAVMVSSTGGGSRRRVVGGRDGAGNDDDEEEEDEDGGEEGGMEGVEDDE